MSTRFARRAALSLGALAFSGALVAAAAPLAAGYSYTFRMSTRTTDHKGKTKQDTPMIAKVQVAGPRARLDIQESKGAGDGITKPGGFMVADRAAKTLAIADPEEKTFTTMPTRVWTDMMVGMTAMAGQMLQVKISDATFKTEDLGSGGVVNGLPTRHYRVTHDYKMDLKIAWSKQNTTNHTVAEYWVNDEIKNHANPMFEIMGAVAAGFLAQDTAFSKEVKRAMDKMFDGVPVRSVTTTTSVNQKGEKTETVSTIEMTDFARGDIPASVFAAPAGYEVKTVTEADLARAAEEQKKQKEAQRASETAEGEGAEAEGETADDASTKAAADTAKKESAKDAVKKKLKGRFGLPE